MLNDEQRQMVIDNMKLIDFAIPNSFQGQWREDVRDLAYIGLCKAVLEYDESLGYTFSTYAVTKIKGEILNSRQVNAVRHMKNGVAIRRYKTEIPADRLVSGDILLIDESYNTMTLFDTIVDDKPFYDDTRFDVEKNVKQLMNKLTDLEKEIFVMLWNGESKAEISRITDIPYTSLCRHVKRIGHKYNMIAN